MAPRRSSWIQLCGRLAVELDGRRVEDELPGRQGRLLFVFLAVNRLRAVPRSELVGALWEDELPAEPQLALSALLSKLRRVLGADVLHGRGEVQLTLPPDAVIDLEAAAAAIHRAESAVAREGWAEVWGPARVALHTARRGFLPGDDAAWVDDVRRRLADIELRAHECLARAGVELGGAELDTAKRSARALVELEPLRESGYRSLMEALAREENVAQALDVYERLRQLLRTELGVAPSEATQALHRRLLG